MVGLATFDLSDWDRAAAAVLDVRVEGPFDGTPLFAAEVLGASFVNDVIVVLGFLSGYSSSKNF